MLRINLLPAYIAERRKVRAAIAVSVVLWLLILGGGLGYNFGKLQPDLATRTQEAADMRAKAEQVTAYESATTQLRAQIAPLQAQVDFVELVQYHNTIRQKIYRQAAAYTYREIELNSMAVQGNTLTLGALAKSVADIGRFYIYMYGNPDVTAVSLAQGSIPSYAAVRAQTPVTYPGGPPPLPPTYRVGLTATLVRAVSPPSLPAHLTGQAAGAGGPGGTIPGGIPGEDGAGGPPPEEGDR